jgi:CRISPR-associated protein Cas1
MTLTDSDVETVTRDIERTYADTRLTETLIVDGFGVVVSVYRGQLTLKDGIGEHRRTRTVPRINRTVKRLLILASGGTLTLDAIRWCADVGITLYMADRDGTLRLLSPVSAPRDARLLRAQAMAPSTGLGPALAVRLLTVKLTGQETVLRDLLVDQEAADRVAAYRTALDGVTTVEDLLPIEGRSAGVYFSAWSQLSCHFKSSRVPDHWRSFSVRRSGLSGRSGLKATCPINAILNYVYALGMAECITACVGVGLEPKLGVMHSDRPKRDSLALDLLETLRPFIDRRVIELLSVRNFSHTDFAEETDGTCRLAPTLAHQLAEWMPSMAKFVAPIAEELAHGFADGALGKTGRPTPLTGANRRKNARDRKESYMPVSRETQNTNDSANRDATWLARSRSRELKTAWDRAHPDSVSDPAVYDREIKPHIQIFTAHQLQTALKVSNGAASSIRSGELRPHARHWPTLSLMIRNPERYTDSVGATGRRSSAASKARKDVVSWLQDNPDIVGDPETYDREIQPFLTAFTSTYLAEYLGVSRSTVSGYKTGRYRPHVRHWSRLRELIDNGK